MFSTRVVFGRACGIFVSTVVVAIAATALGAAERVLFPSALHITRELYDPVSQKTTAVEEYCQGNRMVSVSGRRTAIADYGRGELTEIDFAAGTYSITKFEQIARVYEQNAPAAMQASAPKPRNEWRVESNGGGFVAEKTEAGSRRVIQISADRDVTLSRSAIEALLGIGYPYRANDDAEMLLGALRSRERSRIATNAAAEADEYHLPREQVLRQDVGGETIETRNVVLRIGHELPPLDALAIPPGAQLVESKIVATRRLLEELDRP
jgi:hypothetical protein